MGNALEDQTFGVEVEMYNISRELAAKLVGRFFKLPAWDSAEELKYHSWACKDNKDRTWQFRRDTSIRPNRLKNPNSKIVNFSNVCEVVTPILQGAEDLNTFLDIMLLLIDNGAKSDAGMQCSVHIHVGAKGYNVLGLIQLLNSFAAVEPDLAKKLNVDKYRLVRYCKPLDQDMLDKMNKIRPKKMEDFYDIWYGNCEDKRTDHYNKTRYHALNMHSLKCHGTVEYRIFEFRNQMDIDLLKAFILFCLQFTQKTKDHILYKTSNILDVINTFDNSPEDKELLQDVFYNNSFNDQEFLEDESFKARMKRLMATLDDYSDDISY